MGLLDDAIREHLELKRKHGANPDDVARQEQEALGPGQRNEFAQPEGAEAPPREVESDLGEAAVADVEAQAPVPPPEFEPPPAQPVDELPEEEAPAAVAAGYDEDPWLPDEDDERDEVPADEALQPRPPRPGGAEEDVLEETPDFLQETPEHDRLWFEQKPPRDFDWDK